MSGNPKGDLLAAIRDYTDATRHIPSAKQTVEAALALANDVEQAPNPISQGEGSVPAMNAGSSGQRGQEEGGATVQVFVGGQGQAPRFPDKAGLVARLKGQ